MRYATLFSGIEAPSVAMPHWEAAWFAEIDPFCCHLLQTRYPGAPNLGDVAEIDEAAIEAQGPFDALIGGSPCQDLSVAGRGEGFAGARSALFYHQARIFHAARSIFGSDGPRWLVWENVPGSFSSNQGRDFAAVVGSLAGLRDVDVPQYGWGKEGVALGEHGLLEWSTLDAQWFGLAQRRKRVFAVLDTGDWRSRRPILLERESLRGDSPPSRETGADASGGLGAGAEEGQQQVADPICANEQRTYTHEGKNNFRTRNVVAFSCKGYDADSETDLSPTLRAMSHAGSHTNGGGQVAFAQNQRGEVVESEVAQSISTGGGKPGQGYPAARIGLRVRRLTPTECERLQGFPDGWTDVGYRTGADSPRYRALGNSMAVPVVRWILERMEEAS